MSEDAEISRRVRRASQILLIQRPRAPGVKGWELKRALGKDYMKIVDILDTHLDKLGLQVKVVFEEGEQVQEPTLEQTDRARFFVIMKSPPASFDVISTGWRIDDIAVLAATLSYIISRQGRAPRSDVERVLRERFPSWKVDSNLERYLRRGYIAEDKDERLIVGWRTRAEVDQKTLMSLILATAGGEAKEDHAER